jgi:hypothetical protein
MKFKIKNLIVFAFVLIIVITLLSGCSCATKESGTEGTPEGGIIPEAGPPASGEEEPTGITGNMTEEMCVELMARNLYWVYLFQENTPAAMRLLDETETLNREYGVTDEDYEEVCNALVGDMEFMERVNERMIELGFSVEE